MLLEIARSPYPILKNERQGGEVGVDLKVAEDPFDLTRKIGDKILIPHQQSSILSLPPGNSHHFNGVDLVPYLYTAARRARCSEKIHSSLEAV